VKFFYVRKYRISCKSADRCVENNGGRRSEGLYFYENEVKIYGIMYIVVQPLGMIV
jgi:hypothetical protein